MRNMEKKNLLCTCILINLHFPLVVVYVAGSSMLSRDRSIRLIRPSFLRSLPWNCLHHLRYIMHIYIHACTLSYVVQAADLPYAHVLDNQHLGTMLITWFCLTCRSRTSCSCRITVVERSRGSTARWGGPMLPLWTSSTPTTPPPPWRNWTWSLSSRSIYY